MRMNIRRAAQPLAREHASNVALALDAACVALLLAVSLAVSLANLQTSYDDAYITFRYSYNLATGNGFVYNPGERFLGTTAPLYGLLLGLLGLPAPDAIPLLGSLIAALSLALSSLGLYVYGRLHGAPLSGLLAGLFFAASPIPVWAIGGEMPLLVAIVVWSFVAYRLDRTLLAAALLAAGTLVRPDTVLAAGCLGLHMLVARRRLPWRELLVIVGVVLPFAVLAYWYYGQLLPGTLAAKRAQIASGLWPPFLRGLGEWLRAASFQDSSTMFPGMPAAPAMVRFIPLLALGLPALLVYRFWLLPLGWSVLFTSAYHALGVPFYHWYAVPALLGLAIVAGCGANLVCDGLAYALRVLRGCPLPAGSAAAIGGIAVLALLPGLVRQTDFLRRLGAGEPSPNEQLYIEAGRWLAQNTPAGASIGYFEIGYLGYTAQRRIVDPVGLVNAGVADAVARGDLTWAYRHYRPDYIVHNQQIFVEHIGKMLSEPWFRENYTQIGRIGSGPATLIVYRRTGAP